MTSIENLTKYLTKYNGFDLALTGKPQITYNCISGRYNLEFKRHTNFSQGLITLKMCENINNINVFVLEQIDLVNDLIICIDDLEKLDYIKLIYNNSTLDINLDYIKLLNLVQSNVIKKFNNLFIITLNMINFFNIQPFSTNKLTGIPIFSNKITIEVKSSYQSFNFIEVKCAAVMLNFREKEKIMDCYFVDGFKTIKNILNNNNIIWINASSYENLCIVVDDYKNMSSIEIESLKLNDLVDPIVINKEAIEIYNKLFEKILFEYNGKTIIKIKVVIDTEVKNDLKIKINYIDDLIRDHCYYSITDLNQVKTPYLCTFTNNFKTYYNSWIFDLNDDINGIVNINLDNTHIKNIIIYYTDFDGTIIPIANKFDVDIDDINEKYTDLDCFIYQQNYFNVSDPNINVISFTSMPKSHHPTGQINVTKSIQISYNLKYSKSNLKMHVIIFGYKTKFNIE